MARISEALAIAVRQHQAGQLRAAEQIYRQILAVEPNHADAWHLLGMLAGELGEHQAGVECIRRALALKPDFFEAHYNLGNTFKTQGKLDEAVACYRRALELRPDSPEACNNLAIALKHQGKLDEAVACYRRTLELQPDSAEAHNNLGIALQELGKLDQAFACYRRALELKPDYAKASSNLGAALQHLGDLEGAAACCRQALALRPDFAEAHNNLGNVFRAQGRLDEALACYRRTLELKPDYAEGHFNLGIALQDQGKLDEAIVCYRRALDLRPNYAEVQNNLGNAFRDQANLDEAIVHYRRALELKPDYSRAHSNLLYTLSFHAGCVAVDILQEGRRWNQRHAEPLAGLIAPHWNDRNPDRRLRVGYISPDFRDHCQAFFTVPLFSAHDHRQFEIFYYADVAAPDHVTARLQTDADRWRNIVRLDPQQVAQRIRQDQIDILVDLTMHMAGSHLLVFARRPAPVQVCWLAYPGTTGLSAIDYRLTDVHLDPPGLNDRYYTEESIRLPDSFWCYDPLRREPAVSPLPASDKRCVTFGCLNNFCKINAAVLKLWAQVLRSVGQSRLMLLAAEGSARRHTQDLLEQEGVAPDRVVFVSRRPRSEYLQLYQHIDIGLDTFPYNGHTTSLDSFWMGVPVVTLVGQTVAGRGGLCQLMNLGLPELVAETPEQFVQVAVQLAGDLPRLRELRAGLRDRLERSPLMDAPRFARNVETAYRRMWRRWCAEGRSENRSEPAPDTGSTHNFREGPS